MSVAILLSARRRPRPRLALLLLTLLLIAASLVHLGLGARWIAPQTVLRALLEYDPRNFEQRIIVDLRLVRLAAALLTGAALGVAGLLLQTVIRNPLGEPHILGLNAGASLAVVATSALGLSFGAFPAGRPLTAACGAGLLFGGVMALASAGRGGATPLRITLCGVALSGFASAVTAAILILDEQTLLAMRTWLAGDLAGLNWSTLQTALVPALIGLGVALLIAPRLNVLALGDKVALGLGVNLVQTRLLGLLAIALLCGAAVAVAGPIGFVGLVVPHVVRRLVTEDIRLALPLAAPVGALALVLADIAARTLAAPQELATGAMTALLAPQEMGEQPRFILFDIRLPRILMALLCGAMLGLAGAAMQSITRNGLADPGLIGVKEGASIVVLALVLFFPAVGLVWRPLAGMVGGIAVALLVLTLARDCSRPRFILIGIGVSWSLAAAVGIFMTTADVRDVQTAMIWLAGSLQAATWPLLAVAFCWALPGAIILFCTARAADVALLGDRTAIGLGVRLQRLTVLRFFAPVLLTSASVSCVGSLGFVGLMAPHMARFVLRGGQVSLLCGSALIGALLVLATDTLGRLAFAPLQIPAGIVIALVGCPFFVVLLWRRRDAL
ncbi:TPA: iron ABC transporter permease [Klebsiella pneumoniae]|nr:iron ABC transporter permease [Klebsiella pneumoniae]